MTRDRGVELLGSVVEQAPDQFVDADQIPWPPQTLLACHSKLRRLRSADA